RVPRVRLLFELRQLLQMAGQELPLRRGQRALSNTESRFRGDEGQHGADFEVERGRRPMIGSHFSLILLPTNKCNVDCEYCFEDKTDDFMSLEGLSAVIGKLLDHMERRDIAAMTVYWQGGEVMLLPAAWFERADEMFQEAAAARGRHIEHSLQSNMIGYNKKWARVIAGMF